MPNDRTSADKAQLIGPARPSRSNITARVRAVSKIFLKLAFASTRRNCRCYARAHYRRANASAVSDPAAEQGRCRAGKNRRKIDIAVCWSIDRESKASVQLRGFRQRRLLRTALSFTGILQSRGKTQRDWENGAPKRRRANLVQSSSSRARSPDLSRDRATKNPRAVVHRWPAPQRNNSITHAARHRSGQPRPVNVGSDVAIATEFERSTKANSAGVSKSRDVALARANFRKRACNRRRATAGMRFADEPDIHERSIRHDVQRAVVSRVVFQSGFADGLRISSPLPATIAVPPVGRAMGLESTGPHVRRARVVVDLSGRAVRSNPSQPDGSGCFGFKSRHNSAPRL